MWPSNVKKQKANPKTKTTPIYLIHTHTHAHTHTYTHASSFTRTHTFLNCNLDSDRHSFIYMNIQYIYNTQLVQKDKTIYTHTQIVIHLSSASIKCEVVNKPQSQF